MTRGPLSLALVLAGLLAGCRAAPPRALTVLAGVDVETLDPHASGGLYASRNVLGNVYDGLVARDGELRLRPALASSWSNPDERTWEFVLRRGVRFHDDTILTASDVVESFHRAQRHPRSSIRSDLASVSEVTAPAPDVVRIRTREPDAALLSLLPEVFVMAHARDYAESVVDVSLGTGPYRLARHAPGSSVDLEAFPLAWSGAPALTRIRVLPFAYDSDRARAEVPGGAPVLFWTPPGAPAFERASREQILHRTPGLHVQYLSFDLRPRESPGVRLPAGEHGNPFLDRGIREAVSLSIDYEALRRGVLGGMTRPATQMVPPAVFGYDPTLPETHRDLTRARRLMAESAHPHGFEVDLDVREQVGASFAPYLAASLGAIGIRVHVVNHADREFFEHLRAGRSSLYLLRHGCRTGEAQDLLDRLVHSRDDARGYGFFSFSYERDPVPGLDELVEEARRTLEPTRRRELLQDAMRRVTGEHLFVPLLGEDQIQFLSRGMKWTPRTDSYYRFAEIQPER